MIALRVLLACGLLVLVGAGTSCGHPDALGRELIVLGVDGMDPAFVERHWPDLPNLAALKATGTYSHLATTWPPQSPVAWSSFITGLTPDEHGIFDFVHRDAKTLEPFSSISRTEEPRFTLPLGPYRLPLSRGRVVSLRRGEPFWKTLADRGASVTVIKMPTNYPPVPYGRGLAGMGVPDLRGTTGTFTFFSDDPTEWTRSVPGGEIVQAHLDQGHALLPLAGPPNSLRKDGRATMASLEIDVDAENPVARFRLDGYTFILKEGEWSDWIPVSFALIPRALAAHGMVRIFAKQLHSGLEIYVSAINADPLDPSLPLAHPSGWGAEVARETGRYFTIGIPEDTAVLRQGLFTLEEFRAQTHLVWEDEHRLLMHAVSQLRGGLLFFYISSVDENAHMLWARHEPELLEVYKEVDHAVGEVRNARPKADLIILSDHGFAAFDRAVHLNTWLYDHGFLALQAAPAPDTDLSGADWPKTRAYAIGLNALYVNETGREAHGVVSPGAARSALLASLREQLLAWRDPENGRQVVEALETPHPTAANAEVAPDLIVGYAPGYRASWQTGLGGVPVEELEDNRDAWIGDHCIDPAAVPGVLFLSRRQAVDHPRIESVTAMALAFFGVPGRR